MVRLVWITALLLWVLLAHLVKKEAMITEIIQRYFLLLDQTLVKLVYVIIS